MISGKTSRMLLNLDVRSAEGLCRVVAKAMSRAEKIAAHPIELDLLKALRGDGYSIGQGVAICYTERADVAETGVWLVTLRQPLPLDTVDEQPPDIFAFLLLKPDPQGHWFLLAHLARLLQSRRLLEGLRQADDPEHAVQIIRSAEAQRRAQTESSAGPPSNFHTLVCISVEGENVVDQLLIELVEQGLGEASVLEAQTVHQAAAREVPLFAGFRDLLGDPAGRRVVLIETTADRTEGIIDAVWRHAEAGRAQHASVAVIPIQLRWTLTSAYPEATGER